MRPNTGHGILRWCWTALPDVAPHGTSTSKQNKSLKWQRLDFWDKSLCLQNHLLLALLVATALLCEHRKQRPQTSLAKDSSKGIARGARKACANVDLELFPI
jgi:hypothetical protein